MPLFLTSSLVFTLALGAVFFGLMALDRTSGWFWRFLGAALALLWTVAAAQIVRGSFFP